MSLIFALPGSEALARELAKLAGLQLGSAQIRRFPDGESYLRVKTPVAGLNTIVVCSFGRPDARFLQTVFLARLLGELGAKKVTLVAPYLPYLRQDARFNEGEALTSRHFAAMLSREVDRILTVAPHLHRYHSLSEIYSVPAEAISVAPLFAQWILRNATNPLVVGPDSESLQWVSEIGEAAGAPFLALSKLRSGDREVEIDPSGLDEYRGRQPVLVDDIVSSGQTMLKAARAIIDAGFAPPPCLAVHALMSRRDSDRLAQLGCDLVATNTVPHPASRLSVAPLLAPYLQNGT